jgi:tetratricopeptide (TPR) repeat protein
VAHRIRNFFAVRTAPEAPPATMAAVQALIDEGRLEDALCALRALLSATPDHAEAWYKQGNVLKDLHRSAEALDSYARAIELEPRHTAAQCNRGTVLLADGRTAEALRAFSHVNDIDPHDAIAYYNRGVAEQTLDQSTAALASYGRALELNPRYAEAYFNRARLWEGAARWREALNDYEKALALCPALDQAHFHRGNVLARLRHWHDALASFDLALAVDAGLSVTHLHRGNVLRELRDWDAALISYERALAIDPGEADAHYNHAVVLELLKRFPAALQGFERAIAIRPDHVAARYNRALLLLQTGELAAGFADYEWRWKNRVTGFDPAAYHGGAPLWSGRDTLAGKRILVFSEHGLGDTLQFCRYLKRLTALGAQVIFEVQPPLVGLLAGIDGASTVIARGDPVPAFDTKCALMSLPLAFNTTLTTIPAERKYLHPEAAAIARWRARLGPQTRPRIGLAWSAASRLRRSSSGSRATSNTTACKGTFAPRIERSWMRIQAS